MMAQRRRRSRALALATLFLALALASLSVLAAPGSWVSEAQGARLFTPGRMIESAPLTPPAELVEGALIRSLRWRFTVPSGQPRPDAWLCHPRRCIALASPRGKSRALAGLAADEPLVFRFRLPASSQPAAPFRIESLQVIVDYD